MCQMLPQPTLFMPRMPLVTQGRAKSIHLKGWSQKSHLEKKKDRCTQCACWVSNSSCTTYSSLTELLKCSK